MPRNAARANSIPVARAKCFDAPQQLDVCECHKWHDAQLFGEAVKNQKS